MIQPCPPASVPPIGLPLEQVTFSKDVISEFHAVLTHVYELETEPVAELIPGNYTFVFRDKRGHHWSLTINSEG